jgi:hypothetical protein
VRSAKYFSTVSRVTCATVTVMTSLFGARRGNATQCIVFTDYQTTLYQMTQNRGIKAPLQSDRIMLSKLANEKSYMIPLITAGSFSTSIVLPLTNITKKLGSDHVPICPNPLALPTVTAPMGLGLTLYGAPVFFPVPKTECRVAAR